MKYHLVTALISALITAASFHFLADSSCAIPYPAAGTDSDSTQSISSLSLSSKSPASKSLTDSSTLSDCSNQSSAGTKSGGVILPDKNVHAITTATGSSNLDSTVNAEALAKAVIELKRADNFAQKITQATATELFNRINQNFEEEATDYNWAPAYEEKVNQLITNSKALDQAPVTSILCKSTLCRIGISAVDNSTINHLANAIAESIKSNAIGLVNSPVIVVADPMSGNTNLYIARSEKAQLF